jgi:hypothetical protein
MPVGNDRDRARAFIESEIVAVGGEIRVTPLRRAGEGVEGFNDLAVVETMKQNQPRAGDDRAAEALTYGLAPQRSWSSRWPLFIQRRADIHAVARWAKVLGPISCKN